MDPRPATDAWPEPRKRLVLRDDERQRYARHLMIPELGDEAHAQLKEARVLVVGTGGLGSPVLYYLAGAGIGRLGIVDSDVVELSNLHRQILHTTADVGRPKVDSAAEKLQAVNPDVRVDKYQARFAAANARHLVDEYDVIVTAVDNFPARFLLNDVCVLAHKTLVEAGILRFMGLAMTIKGGETACYRCLFPEMPQPGSLPGGGEAGVFGPVPGVVGSIQAAEVIKVITGFGRPLYNRLLQFDAYDMSFAEVEVAREPSCPVCGEHPVITELRDEQTPPGR